MDLDSTVDAELNEVWRYVGRFMWGFGLMESFLDEIVGDLFGVDYPARALLLSNLDFNRKVSIVKFGLSEQGIPDAVSSDLSAMADMRNALAHSHFGPDTIGDNIGVDFKYVNRKGKEGLPRRKTEDGWQTIITYGQFDEHYEKHMELCDKLGKLQAVCKPIGSDATRELVATLSEESDALANIVPFPPRQRPMDEQS